MSRSCNKLFVIFILSLLYSLLLSVLSCSEKVIKKEAQSVSFYELCFYFPKLPENTAEKDIKTASAVYEEHLGKTGITVLKRKHTIDSVCYFLDSVPDYSIPETDLSNNISQYLITAYFNKKNSSLYGVFPRRKDSVSLNDQIPFLRKLPPYVEISEGLVISGTNKKLLYISRYLNVLEIEHQFGFNDSGKLIINIKPDMSDRWQMIPFLYDSLQIEDIISPLPGDFGILHECVNESISLKIKTPSWELSSVPVARDMGILNEDALVFSVGVMSLPFDEEILLKYFYSLSHSYLLPPSSGLYYSPNFKGSGVRPTVLLFSSELAIAGEVALTPESIFMWASSVNHQLKSFPDTFYANLLSLKVAKKLYSGNPSFLGGAELVNMTAPVPFEKIRENLFHKGNVSVFGSLNSALYLYTEDIINEYSSVQELSKSGVVKALYGSPENCKYSIMSFVVRSKNAEVINQKIKDILFEIGYIPVQMLFEQVSQNDAWGAVSVVVEENNEKKILDLFEKNFRLLNNTVSVGVYRVSKED